MPGHLKLYSGEMRIKNVYYRDAKNRKAIIESWVCLYGDDFKDLFVQVSPTVDKKFILNKKYHVQSTKT